ncbi:GyrI-like domain-containing protein [Methylocystis parvus]|uniref:GyrI-like small molecule binding domain-containing protein n=1 Tax=Methylocystis parvus TaxID=134 RepID=A0A6B8M215_9HYPH|nr:GyrI-like domain-containing protein [Methylocystis parvus]QGM96306.1 hypothetical protein F7D14_01605 [Methylocystis parvus]WBJ99855.1 GyrI-like domain-containing protein [Methylocystis parvus OBBP]
MTKIDFKKSLPHLYGASRTAFSLVDVPAMQFVMIDGFGDPNVAPSYKHAVESLFSICYAMKFLAKETQEKDYVVPPLEGLWWADDPADFVARRKACWRWTMMIMAPDFIDAAMFQTAVQKTQKKLGAPPESLRLDVFCEGPSLQILHVGAYDDEGPVLARLHGEEMPSRGFAFGGKHHEIYLSDARRTEPAKLRTILRQPVRRA